MFTHTRLMYCSCGCNSCTIVSLNYISFLISTFKLFPLIKNILNIPHSTFFVCYFPGRNRNFWSTCDKEQHGMTREKYESIFWRKVSNLFCKFLFAVVYHWLMRAIKSLSLLHNCPFICLSDDEYIALRVGNSMNSAISSGAWDRWKWKCKFGHFPCRPPHGRVI